MKKCKHTIKCIQLIQEKYTGIGNIFAPSNHL